MLKRIPWKDVFKFLAGAFFVSAGVQLYLYLGYGEENDQILTNRAKLLIYKG